MKEKNPFLKDTYFCNCGKEAGYECPTCRRNVCSTCAVTKSNKPEGLVYCPTCNYRLYPIPLRFVGSTREMQKFNGVIRQKMSVAPKFFPKGDREKILRCETE